MSTVNIHGAADLMKVHPKTVLDMIGTGELPAAKVGRAYVMLTRDVLQHIENQIIRQTAKRMRTTTSSARVLTRAGLHIEAASARSNGR